MRRFISVFLFLFSIALLVTLKAGVPVVSSTRDTCAKTFHDCYFAARNAAARQTCQQSFAACMRSCPAATGTAQKK